MAFIRSATELDISAITEIYAHHVRHGSATFETEPPDCIEMERRRTDIVSQSLPYLVAEGGNRVIGYAYAGRYRPRPAYRFTVEDSIYIHPDFLARGLGRMLLGALIELCNAEGCRQMIAIIGDSGNTASIRLHERFGFRRAGVLEQVGRKFGRWIDTVVMQRALEGDSRLAELRTIVERGGSRTNILTRAADFLRRSGGYRWVGFYDVDHAQGEVRNLVFSGSGAPAYPTFPIQKGLSGVAIGERRTVNIGDVSVDPQYLTAFGTTRSEIIVPIFAGPGKDGPGNTVAGTLDVESEKLQAFSDRDQVFLEDCAEMMRPLWKRD
jgi:L-amino acid N-acyltransferase YncA/putative methionine-R-sulfoxide reductase with GAF domain